MKRLFIFWGRNIEDWRKSLKLIKRNIANVTRKDCHIIVDNLLFLQFIAVLGMLACARLWSLNALNIWIRALNSFCLILLNHDLLIRKYSKVHCYVCGFFIFWKGLVYLSFIFLVPNTQKTLNINFFNHCSISCNQFVVVSSNLSRCLCSVSCNQFVVVL